MLHKLRRIVNEVDIVALLRTRGKFTPHFRVHTRPNLSSISRFGFLVSKKISLKSTERNRMKRQLREIVGHLLTTIRPGVDCLIVVRKTFIGSRFDQIRGEIVISFEQGGVLPKKN